MLLWINGPHGGGKTQTAHEVQRRLPGSVICDPEHVGFGLHRMTPPGLRGDFQDFPAWRQGVREVLELTLGRHPGPVIVPMTVTDPGYLAEILDPLRARGHRIHHFALLAERETVLNRLRERGFGHLVKVVGGKDVPLRRESWAVARLDHGLQQLGRPEFAEQLWTDHLTVAQVADRLAAASDLRLLPNTDSALRGRLRRALTGIRHIRLD
ncbi:AAA family ATPase [Kitasatospora sp. NPDC058965]|uniref:AAA family ATPase n=1 Tax=Kitasatospora sp. NPDC058965 TaxID=3346682 RepID=UPI003682B2CF